MSKVKFEIGDIVVIYNTNLTSLKKYKGKRFIICNFVRVNDFKGDIIYKYDLKPYKSDLYCPEIESRLIYENDLMLYDDYVKSIEPAKNKFEIGDRVVLCNTRFLPIKKYIGKDFYVTAIREVNENGHLIHKYKIKNAGISFPDYLLYEDELMLYDDYVKLNELTSRSYELYTKYYISNQSLVPEITNVIFNDPATIIFWNDGTKTVVKAQDEEYDPEKGLAMAISKKAISNKGNYCNVFKKWLDKYKLKDDKITLNVFDELDHAKL